MQIMILTLLAAEQAGAAAALHIAGQPGTFLTSLGPEVLTVFYRVLPVSPVGFGYAAWAAEPAVHPMSTPLAGFVSATTSTGRLFAELGTRHLGAFLPPLLKRFAQQPRLLSASVQTLVYPWLQGNTAKRPGNHAELLSIMVEPTQRNQGIGGQLLAALVAECTDRQIRWLEVTVDANNLGAQRFYERYAFQLTHEFQLFGRKMYSYCREL